MSNSSQNLIKLIILVLSCLLFLHACKTNRLSSVASSLNLLTFNIRYASANDGENAWEHRKDIVVDILKTSQPHIMGIQEAEFKQLEDILTFLPDLKYFGRARDDGKQAGEFSPIFYDPKRLQLLAKETFWFSDTPQIPGSKSWGNDIPRICSWGRFKDLKTGKTFYVYNMHWDHASQNTRLQSGVLLLKMIQQRTYSSDPVIVMGDFNADVSNPALNQLLTNPNISLKNAIPNIQDNNAGTFHGFTGIASMPAIDAILVSEQVLILKTQILNQAYQSRYPSDHFPVSTIIQF